MRPRRADGVLSGVGRDHLAGMRRRLLLGLLLAAPTAALADDTSADIARVQDYLNGLKTLKAKFLQVAPNGAVSQGTVWLERPGRMRFQYDPPTPLLLVAGHGLLVFHDSQLDQTTNIPLGRTPLGILLADNVKLSGDVTVTAVSHQNGYLELSLDRTAVPGDGLLTLFFTEKPFALREWVVTDAQRRETRVTLFDPQYGGTFDQSLFSYVDPKMLQGGTP